MPIPPEIAEHFLGQPDPDDKRVEAQTGGRSFKIFHGDSIPIDGRRYILYGYSVLPNGIRIPSRFELDTKVPNLLGGEPLCFWHIGSVWYTPFEPEALKALGIAPGDSTFFWIPNVPIEGAPPPPYRAGEPVFQPARNP